MAGSASCRCTRSPRQHRSPDRRPRSAEPLHQYCDPALDRDRVKRLIRPTLGFQSIRTAHATIKSFEVVRALRRGQGSRFYYLPGVAGAVSLVDRNFSLSIGLLR